MSDQAVIDRKETATPNARRKVTLLGLIAATYFMVAGGPYSLESVIQGAGYFWAVVFLLIVPVIWSLPTTLMVSELSSAIPAEGGYYVWVRRALGPFWGFQEAWLSLAASVFDMAIYPLLLVTYLGYLGKYLTPAFSSDDLKGLTGFLIGGGMIAVCAAANLLTPRSLGRSALLLTITLLVPFGVLSVLAVIRSPVTSSVEPQPASMDYVTALLFVLWNYMGWDNATTIAGEVERPRHTYPLAMAGAVILVTLTYLIPVVAAAQTGIPATEWTTGYWVTMAERMQGPALAIAIGVGGMISAFGMFNSLVLSYSRLPVVLAEDGYLPALFTRRLRTGAPWVAVLTLAVAWALAMQFGLKRVLALDVILYGLSLLLEFVALVALRIREPRLDRPFRVPGGVLVAALLGVCPALFIGLAVFDQAGKWTIDDQEEMATSTTAQPPEADLTPKVSKPESEKEMIAPAPALLLGAALIALGPIIYYISRLLAVRPVASPSKIRS